MNLCLCNTIKETVQRWSRHQTAQGHTCTHDVVSEERGSKPKGQHEQVAGEAGKQLSEACSIGAEVGKGSCYQHTMRMEAHNVVLPRVQVSCLHKLAAEKKRSGLVHLIPPERAGSLALWWSTWLQPKHVPRFSSFNTVFDPLNLSPILSVASANCPKKHLEQANR